MADRKRARESSEDPASVGGTSSESVAEGACSSSSISRQHNITRPKSHSCSVCLEVFTEPKVLPCCHTFCLKCLEKTARSAEKKGEVTCPQCRQTHQIPEGGLADLLSDFIEDYEIQVSGIKSKAKRRKTEVCGECEQSGAIRSFCSDCKNYLCNECVQLHERLKTFRGHRVTPIEKITAATLQSCKVQYCTAHKQEALKLYCETCMQLICRDCTLVKHRQHNYKFVEDARKQIEDELASLKLDVKEKHAILTHNFQMIKKVEASASDYSGVVKADVNDFFDKLVQSIEARRKVLLDEAEGACQKDLKQVWADKEFHETTMAHIQSVFSLMSKARPCSSDSEMILTALHCISQLRILQGKEWEWFAFTSIVLSTPKFTKGDIFALDKVGGIDSGASYYGMELEKPPIEASLRQPLMFVLKFNEFSLIDRRSGKHIHLQGVDESMNELQAVVQYGKRPKTIAKSRIYIEKIEGKKHEIKGQSQDGYSSDGFSSLNFTYKVTVKQVICGGKHTITFRLGCRSLEHSFTVVGKPQNGDRVKEGPDWKKEASSHRETPCNCGIGSVYECYPYYGHHYENTEKMLNVQHDVKGTCQYKWGKDGEYEVELI